MPRASCDVCLLRIYARDVQICRCDAATASEDCGHWRPHHDEINGLCDSARIGCRMCSELWKHFFKEWTPEQYAGDPTLVTVPGTETQPASWRFTGPGFQVGPTLQVFHNTGIWYRVVELTSDSTQRGATSSVQGDGHNDETVLALDFGISSPMIYEVEERRYILRKTSDYERLVTLFLSGLLQLDEGSSADPQDISQKRWDWVSKWMIKCETDHMICSRAIRANQSSPWFPTRLIDVNARLDNNGRKHYLLIETASNAPNGHRYATLSHIWGSGPEHQRPVYRTVENNYPDRITSGIPRDELPACFQDAIDVTERLDIPYLWIDSLCIIQEDARDWAAEAGRMADVYRNSFLNLSATASSSSRDRFPSLVQTQLSEELGPQAPRLQEPRFVMTGWTGQFAGTYQIFDPQFWADRVTSTRLASRGWIFQERALAPRVLHFGFDQVLWECAESERAEEFPLEIPRRFIDSGRRGFKWQLSVDPRQVAAVNDDDAHATGVADWNHEQHRVLDEKWAKAVENYTRCELTQAKDKLVAISGVAQVLADHFHDEYVVGLWRSNLVGALCWRVPQMRRTTQKLIPSGFYARRWEISRRFVEYIAPSWSWASVEGEVTAGPFVSEQKAAFRTQSGEEGYKTMRSLVGVPDVDSIPITDIPVTDTNELGEVKRTEMRLRGTLYQLRATADEPNLDDRFSFYYIGSLERAVVYLDQPEELQDVKEAYFLPLVYVQCCLTVSATAAAPKGRPHSWVTRLKQKGKSLTKKESTVDLPGEQVHMDASNAVPNHDLDYVLGIVVVCNENSKVYRRVGFHECKANVLKKLQDKPDASSLEALYTLV